MKYFLLTEVPTKRRRRGGLDHVLNPELGLPRHPCHQANHPHTKILYIQLASLLWRAGNPARNAPGTVLCYCHTAVLLSVDCAGVCDQTHGVRSFVLCAMCACQKYKSLGIQHYLRQSDEGVGVSFAFWSKHLNLLLQENCCRKFCNLFLSWKLS